MIIKYTIGIFLSLTSIISLGCKNDFSPYTDNVSGIVAFTILDNRLHEQELFVSAVKSGSGLTDLSGYEYYLYDNEGNKYKFQETNKIDGIFIRYHYPDLALKRGQYYTFRVEKDSQIYQYSSLLIPDSTLRTGTIGFNGDYYAKVLFLPRFSTSDGSYYRFKTMIEYEVEIDGIKNTKYKEIPYTISINKSVIPIGANLIEYPEEAFINMDPFEFKNYTSVINGRYTINSESGLMFSYKSEAVFYAFKFLEGYKEAKSITIKRAFAVCQKCDKNLYEKYLFHSEDELSSSRMDQVKTYFTNMSSRLQNQFGFMGAITTDTVNIRVNNEILDFFKYKNGQP